jgi:hypothetical protein
MLELEQRGGTTWEQCGVESNVCRLEPVWRLGYLCCRSVSRTESRFCWLVGGLY